MLISGDSYRKVVILLLAHVGHSSVKVASSWQVTSWVVREKLSLLLLKGGPALHSYLAMDLGVHRLAHFSRWFGA